MLKAQKVSPSLGIRFALLVLAIPTIASAGVEYFSLDPSYWSTGEYWSDQVKRYNSGHSLVIQTYKSGYYSTYGYSKCIDYKDLNNKKFQMKFRLVANTASDTDASISLRLKNGTGAVQSDSFETPPWDDNYAKVVSGQWLYFEGILDTTNNRYKRSLSTTGYGNGDLGDWPWGSHIYFDQVKTNPGAPSVSIKQKGAGSYLQIAEARLVPVDFTPRLHVVTVGMDYGTGLLAGGPDGKYHAEAIYQGISRLGAMHPDNPAPIILDYNGSDNDKAIKNAIDDIKSRVRPGDQFVFYYVGHGGYETPEVPVETPVDITAPWFKPQNTGDEFLKIGDPEKNFWIYDNTLKDWFNDPAWNTVDKTFILDACFSGGFWTGDEAPDGDLNLLPRTCLLASAPENRGAQYDTFTGRSNYSSVIEGGLNWMHSQGSADIHDLIEYVNLFDSGSMSGSIYGYLADMVGETSEELEWEPIAEMTEDFGGDISPEPGTVGLLALGGLVLTRRRRPRRS